MFPPHPPHPPHPSSSTKIYCYGTIQTFMSSYGMYEECVMARWSISELRQFILAGETNSVELKAAAPRPVEMAERLCGLANAHGGIIIIGVEDSKHSIVGVPDNRMAMTIDTVLRA